MKTYKTNEIISLLLDKSKKNGATDTEVIISKSYGKSLEVRNSILELEYLKEKSFLYFQQIKLMKNH